MADGTTTPPATTAPADRRGITPEGWLTDSWYLACASKALKKGKQFRRMICGEPVLLARTEAGEAFALRDICPHRLVPLSAGRQVETEGEPTVECPYHGWRFGTDGVCRLMPSLVDDDQMDPSRVKVRRYPVHEAHGMVFVFVRHDPRATAAPDVPPPDFGELPDRPKYVLGDVFNAHMDDAVVGLMDPAHVGFVHNQWWWRPPSTGLRLKEKRFEPRERGWAIARHQPSSSSVAYKALFGGDVTTEILFQLPGYRWEVVENERARLLTLTCLTPEEAKRTRITQFTWWWGAPLLNLLTPVMKPPMRTFLRQDGRMVDLQNESMAHQNGMLWIDDIDVQAKWYQTLKKEWSASRTEARPFANPVKARSLRWKS